MFSRLMKILPVYGEGDHRAAMVEGAGLLSEPPSVSASRCHLPTSGEDR